MYCSSYHTLRQGAERDDTINEERDGRRKKKNFCKDTKKQQLLKINRIPAPWFLRLNCQNRNIAINGF